MPKGTSEDEATSNGKKKNKKKQKKNKPFALAVIELRLSEDMQASSEF